jgi:hypothetical protein
MYLGQYKCAFGGATSLEPDRVPLSQVRLPSLLGDEMRSGYQEYKGVGFYTDPTGHCTAFFMGKPILSGIPELFIRQEIRAYHALWGMEWV